MGTHPIFESDFDCLTDAALSSHRPISVAIRTRQDIMGQDKPPQQELGIYGSFRPMIWFFIMLWSILGFVAFVFFVYLNCCGGCATFKHHAKPVKGRRRKKDTIESGHLKAHYDEAQTYDPIFA